MAHPFIEALPSAKPARLNAALTKAKSLNDAGADNWTDDEVTLATELAPVIKGLRAHSDAAKALDDFMGAGRTTSAWKNGEWTSEPLQTDHRKASVEPRSAQAKAFTEAMAKALDSNPASLRTKAGVLPQSGTATQFDFSGPLVSSPRGPLTIADLVQHVPTGAPSGTVLVQTARTNRAASVPVGGYKPASDYALTPRTWRVATLAHVVVVPRQYLADYAGLSDFLGAELAFGLADVLDEAVLNGTTDEEGNPAPGLLSATTAIPTSAFSADAYTSLRSGIGALDQSGITSSAVVLNPLDWQALELIKGNDGHYLLPQAPADRAPRNVWGLPVVLSNRQPAGKAIVGDFANALLMEREAVRIEAFEQGMANEASGSGGSRVEAQDLARRNEVLIRAEMRATPVVQTPAAFRVVSLTA